MCALYPTGDCKAALKGRETALQLHYKASAGMMLNITDFTEAELTAF